MSLLVVTCEDLWCLLLLFFFMFVEHCALCVARRCFWLVFVELVLFGCCRLMFVVGDSCLSVVVCVVLFGVLLLFCRFFLVQCELFVARCWFFFCLVVVCSLASDVVWWLALLVGV